MEKIKNFEVWAVIFVVGLFFTSVLTVLGEHAAIQPDKDEVSGEKQRNISYKQAWANNGIGEGIAVKTVVDSKDNIIIAGYDWVMMTGLVAKYNKDSGSTIWCHRSRYIGHGQKRFFGVDVTAYDNIIVGGGKQNLNTGVIDTIFEKRTSGRGIRVASSSFKHPNGGSSYCDNLVISCNNVYATLCSETANGMYDGVLLKLKASTLQVVGDLIRPDREQTFCDVTVDSNGDVLVAGMYGEATENDCDTFILRCNSDLTVLDEFSISIYSGIGNRPNAIDVDQDNNIFVAGTKISNNGNVPYLVKLNSTGTVLWEQADTSGWLVPDGEFTDMALRGEDVVVSHAQVPYCWGNSDAFHVLLYNGTTGNQRLEILNETELVDQKAYQSLGVAVDSHSDIVACGLIDLSPILFTPALVRKYTIYEGPHNDISLQSNSQKNSQSSPQSNLQGILSPQNQQSTHNSRRDSQPFQFQTILKATVKDGDVKGSILSAAP
jgi:hypothetical protein